MLIRSLGLASLLSAAALCASAQTPPPGSTARSPAQTSTDHLKLRTWSRPTAVAPGVVVALLVDVEPRRGMHVYAPGDHTYRVISLSLTPQPFIRPLPVKYPPSETYHFVPLNERVAVYMKPFTLVQEVALEDTDSARKAFADRRELIVTGSLAYQACDDRLCFNPVSVPVTWRVQTDTRSAPDAAAAK